jgi:hypothetical protein
VVLKRGRYAVRGMLRVTSFLLREPITATQARIMQETAWRPLFYLPVSRY